MRQLLAILAAALLVVGIGRVSLAQPFSVVDTFSVAAVDPVDSSPYALAFHPTLPLVYVSLSGDPAFMDPQLFNGTTVAEIDMGTGSVLRQFTVGLFPTELVIDSTATELFVSSSTAGEIARIDLATGAVTSFAVVDSLGQAVSFISDIALSPTEDALWIASNGGNGDGSDEDFVIVDLLTQATTSTLPTAGGTSRFEVRADGSIVLPVNFPGNVFPSLPEVRIYDLAAPMPNVPLISVPIVVDLTDFPSISDIALSPSGDTAYVSVFGGSSAIHVVDLVTGVELAPIPLPFLDFVQTAIEITPDGTRLVVADFFQAQVRVIDLATGLVADTAPTGSQPNDIQFGGGRVWIPNQSDDSVTVLEADAAFVRGDAQGDGAVGLADVIQVLVLASGGASTACLEAADVDGSGQVELADGIALLSYLFESGPAPAYPFPGAGIGFEVGASGCP